MGNVKIDVREWGRELYSLTEDHFSRNELAGKSFNPNAHLLEHFVTWAMTYYIDKEVPMAIELASTYVEDAEILIRADEDQFLINDKKTRTTPMNDKEWEAYCKEHKVLFGTKKCACISDGYCHTREV
jgi:hypothetical protein